MPTAPRASLSARQGLSCLHRGGRVRQVAVAPRLTCGVHHLEARVVGTFRRSFHNFGCGNAHSFGGEYLELVPDQRIRYADRF